MKLEDLIKALKDAGLNDEQVENALKGLKEELGNHFNAPKEEEKEEPKEEEHVETDDEKKKRIFNL